MKEPNKNQRILLIILLLLFFWWRYKNRTAKSINGGGNGIDQSKWVCVGGVSGNTCEEVNSNDAGADAYNSMLECETNCAGSPANPGGDNGGGYEPGGHYHPCQDTTPPSCIYGCMDPNAENYYPGAMVPDPNTPCCYNYQDCCNKGIYGIEVCGE